MRDSLGSMQNFAKDPDRSFVGSIQGLNAGPITDVFPEANVAPDFDHPYSLIVVQWCDTAIVGHFFISHPFAVLQSPGPNAVTLDGVDPVNSGVMNPIPKRTLFAQLLGQFFQLSLEPGYLNFLWRRMVTARRHANHVKQQSGCGEPKHVKQRLAMHYYKGSDPGPYTASVFHPNFTPSEVTVAR